jgi:putative addiction module component (TIGR02574 family)
LRPGDIIQVMMQEAQELLKKALALPDKERADLAGSLIESLDDTVDENAEAAWQEEIVRRLEDVQSGRVKTTSWDEVRQKGRTLLRNR